MNKKEEEKNQSTTWPNAKDDFFFFFSLPKLFFSMQPIWSKKKLTFFLFFYSIVCFLLSSWCFSESTIINRLLFYWLVQWIFLKMIFPDDSYYYFSFCQEKIRDEWSLYFYFLAKEKMIKSLHFFFKEIFLNFSFRALNLHTLSSKTAAMTLSWQYDQSHVRTKSNGFSL